VNNRLFTENAGHEIAEHGIGRQEKYSDAVCSVLQRSNVKSKST